MSAQRRQYLSNCSAARLLCDCLLPIYHCRSDFLITLPDCPLPALRRLLIVSPDCPLPAARSLSFGVFSLLSCRLLFSRFPLLCSDASLRLARGRRKSLAFALFFPLSRQSKCLRHPKSEIDVDVVQNLEEAA